MLAEADDDDCNMVMMMMMVVVIKIHYRVISDVKAINIDNDHDDNNSDSCVIIPLCGSGVCLVSQNRPTPFPGWMS